MHHLKSLFDRDLTVATCACACSTYLGICGIEVLHELCSWRSTCLEKGKDLHLEGFCRHVQAGSVQISSIADMERAVNVWRGAFKISNPAGLSRYVSIYDSRR